MAPTATPTQPELDPAGIECLVDRFYDKARADALLGPVFETVVQDWPAHKALLTSFWNSVALGTRSYRGNPLGRHRPLPIERRHFDRWLALWREAAGEIFAPEAAEQMIVHAERISRGMRMGLGLGERPPGRALGIPMYLPRRQPPDQPR